LHSILLSRRALRFVFDFADDELEMHDKEGSEYMLMELKMSLRAAEDCRKAIGQQRVVLDLFAK
jgi:hypothetical protein